MAYLKRNWLEAIIDMNLALAIEAGDTGEYVSDYIIRHLPSVVRYSRLFIPNPPVQRKELGNVNDL